MNIELSSGAKGLFLELAEDAGNWGGTPLLSELSAEGKGFLTKLKTAGLVTTFVDRDVRNGLKTADTFVDFTDAGRAMAESLGVGDLIS